MSTAHDPYKMTDEETAAVLKFLMVGVICIAIILFLGFVVAWWLGAIAFPVLAWLVAGAYQKEWL